MAHFRANLRDIEFNLFEVFGLGDVVGRGPFAAMDADTAADVLSEVERLASTAFADAFVEGDREPLRLSADGDVTLPPGMHRALDAYFAGEWHRLALPEHLGGYGAPRSLAWAATELLLGANPAAMMYTAGPVFAAILDPLVTDAQRERWIVPMVERRWGSTMVLTEPDAGSDVGAARTTARLSDDGETWHLTGTKRFITNGDFDWPENILHLVLARAVDADGRPLHGPGTKGLSLFLVPKHWPAADGSPGARNGVVATALEDKMGLKASATCELAFGEREPARGVLVGEVHDGIRQMFAVIEYARMLVGTKAIATLSTGYRNALAYAGERVQGADLAQASDKTAPRVPIIRHPDVRRMLMDCKAAVEGMRALVYYAASLQDRIALAAAAGTPDEPRGVAGGPQTPLSDLVRRNDLLLPLVKGYGSERSYELLAVALQVLGGSGYVRDHPHEQYLRDAKIDTLYEGTTGIQGLDLFFRKIGRDGGETLGALLADVAETAKGDAGNGALAAERGRLAAALEDVQATVAAMAGAAQRSVHLAGLSTTPLLFSLAELVCAWLLVRQAEVALAALDAGQRDADRAFYTGKVAAARWYARTVLPGIAARRAVVESADLAAMELDDAAF